MKKGFVTLFGEDHAKSFDAIYSLLFQTTRGDELIAGLRALWERVKVSLPQEAITYDVATSLGLGLREKGKNEDATVFYLAALEGFRRSTRSPSIL